MCSEGIFLSARKRSLSISNLHRKRKTEIQAKACVVVHCQIIVPLETMMRTKRSNKAAKKSKMSDIIASA